MVIFLARKDATVTNTPVQPSARVIPTRRVSFEDSLRDIPKYFAGGDVMHSHILAALSSVFPDGEDFFVRSVRHYRDQITDPEFKRQVNGFIGQEATHGREHRVFNNRLAELGYPTKQSERFTRRGLALRTKVAPAISNLAATAALEHFTATLAEVLLTDPAARESIGDGPVLNLMLWHALEESEHKAVAFDVYRAVGGSERMRVWTMKSTRVGFVLGMTLQVIASVLRDREAFRDGNLRRSLKNFRHSPLMKRSTWVQLCEYDRPGFHPDDNDTFELEEHWREVLFGDAGLVTSSAAA
jgi:predicted metal-dependent hydrolase